MNVSDAVAQRASIRAFLDRPVNLKVLLSVIQQAARAPSSGNLQPWRLYVLHGRALDDFRAAINDKLASGAQEEPRAYQVYPQPLGEPYRGYRYRVGEAMYGLLGIGRDEKERRLAWFANNFRFFDAPCAVFFFVETGMGPGQWADLGMYQQSMMLLLKEQGLDTCMQACWTRYHQTVKALLGVPDGLVLHAGMAIGYADPEAAVNRLKSERMPLDTFCTVVRP
ncbi:nitroreductase [Stutzerimonas tarimensis]|uniref:Nitroreductase n=1 Tax=Stutzerimonas tarimensis TaxID=1507735 RepID=A0ABV7T9Q3_9GAMM